MKKYALLRLIIAGLLATAASGHAQFPIRLGSVGQEYGKCAATDRDGNILIGMLFQNTIDFDPGTNTVMLGTPPGIDCALAKYKPAGQLLWARHITGTAGASANTVCTPHGVAVDAQNNIILVGYFGLSASATRAVADFDSGSGTLLLTNTGGWDPFIAKFDASGGVLWARTFGNLIKHVHWKDIPAELAPKRGQLFGCGMGLIPLGDGIVGIPQVVAELKKIGFNGPTTLEIAGENALRLSAQRLEQWSKNEAAPRS